MNLIGTVRYIVIHHSATRSGSVESFRHAHTRKPKPGFLDIGYHYVIGNGAGMPDGEVGEGRDVQYKGAAVKRNNTGKIHICLVGNLETDHEEFTGAATKQQLNSLGKLLVFLFDEYRDIAIVGHREVALNEYPTLCPGSSLDLDNIRLWADGAVPGRMKEELGDWMEFTGVVVYLHPEDLEKDIIVFSRAKIIDNKVYIPAGDLVYSMGWELEWDGRAIPKTLDIWVGSRLSEGSVAEVTDEMEEDGEADIWPVEE